MDSEMRDIAVQITRFVDPHNPGVVECELVDAKGHIHTFIDKVPVFTEKSLNAHSTYPQAGGLLCRILEKRQEPDGRCLVRVRTLESTEGVSEIVVASEQLLGPGLGQ